VGYRAIVAAIESLESRRLLAAQMIADLEGGTDGSSLDSFVVAGSIAYFIKYNDNTGPTLYKTDGTAPGTQPVFDFPQDGEHFPGAFTAVGNRVFFTYGDAAHGIELWSTDGTTTAMVKDILSGTSASNPINLTDVDGTLYFSLYGVSHSELWKSDGTSAGTQRVATIDSNLPLVTRPYSFVSMGSQVYFLAQTSADGNALWKTDGTEAGTSMVADPNPGPDYYSWGDLARVGSKLFFSAEDSVHGPEPWVSDGTTAGTHMIADLNPSAVHLNPGDNGSFPGSFVDLDGTAIFTAQDGANSGPYLWRSDGTAAGTQPINQTIDTAPTSLVRAGDHVFFAASSPAFGRELWATDGTSAAVVKDLDPAGDLYPDRITAVGSRVFFTGLVPNTSGDEELYISDGTEAGTALVKDINPGDPSSFVSRGVDLNGRLFFSADDGIHGSEPYISDGTAAGTNIVVDLNLVGQGSTPGGFVTLGNHVFFNASVDGQQDSYVMNADGTSITKLNGVFMLGPAIAYENYLIFSGIDTTTGDNELWISDGTQAGTMQLADINSGTENGSGPHDFVEFNNEIFFIATTPLNGREVWKTNGTTAGTVRLKETGVGSSSFAGGITVSGGSLYFAANSDLYRSDGTEAGTTIAASLASDTFFLDDAQMVDVNGALFLPIATAGVGSDLATYNPFDGLKIIKHFPLIAAPPQLQRLSRVGDKVYFEYDDTYFSGPHELRLYSSDGTTAGTQEVDLGISRSYVGGMTVLNGKLFFIGRHSNDNFDNNGEEPWVTDGTPGGTFMLKDTNPGDDSSNAQEFVSVGGLVYFNAFDPVHGTELWSTDGTAAGTQLVQDINPGTAESFPTNLGNGGGNLFFAANDGVHGHELWRLADATAPKVIDAEFSDELSPQSMDFQFNEDVSQSLTSASITITNLSANFDLPSGSIALKYDHATNRASFAIVLDALSLADGNYRATLHHDGVNDLSSNGLADDQTLDFFVFRGDANGDRRINALDFNILAAHFGEKPSQYSRGDFNYDRKINSADFNLLAQRFHQNFAAPARLPGATSMTFSAIPIRDLFQANDSEPGEQPLLN
jgi:ELWxxDGT repeat protein